MSAEQRRGTTGEGRLAFPQLWEPKQYQGKGEATYGCILLVPKTDTATKAAIETAIMTAWIETYGQTPASGAAFQAFTQDKKNYPISDGDDPKHAGTQGYAGHWAFRFKAKDSIRKPQIVDERVEPLLDRAKLYSGVKARVVWYAYSWGQSQGVSLQCDIVQRTGDAQPFSAAPVDPRSVLQPVAGAAAPAANPFGATPGFGQMAVGPAAVNNPFGNPFGAAPAAPTTGFGAPAPAADPFGDFFDGE